LTGKHPENAAHVPAAGKARVDRKRTVDQPDHRADILAEIRQGEGRVGEDARVILPHLECLPSKIASLAPGCFRLFDPAISDEVSVAVRRPGEGRPITGIDRDRLFEQSQSLDNPLFLDWKEGQCLQGKRSTVLARSRTPCAGEHLFKSLLDCDDSPLEEEGFELPVPP
jgi:hypothetical protein